ncbi:MAG: hypothetical protein A2445_01025 [Candidatus Jacksonbacteria bacterium RIFOXYC2_FULL_44_29]|nr:MAG: hypothetical protein UW45_C0019G0037 [Parcubacteria group bacterium GW2011_GWC2_44_22]OGY74672.1 MAG: hypothetical protein A2240_06160 [Candidatus Jacksonbacteria bacterium RIFOXYA2_FULL_43_12]OGY75375.1 MAG: hypothetical protein A2295_04325 [Candidatus Jacksonbacteria bacterium RIFOXYB2_FULL_44_15]OGY77368.1 MAG: hypothetical protein A2445_01025 [Candidatus Jacksonbacteria bacterium RIFOXYC2_FULL_44_29]OGY82014.1 MAG: hypothetical protein A2550_00380 [Candidatus Jacksonbacteria bacteri
MNIERSQKNFEIKESESKDRSILEGLYRDDPLIRDYLRILYTCNKILAEREDIGTAISFDSEAASLYEFAGWPLRDLWELADECRRSLEIKSKKHNIFLDLATNETEKEIMAVARQLIAAGEAVELTEEEFKEIADKKYAFGRS